MTRISGVLSKMTKRIKVPGMLAIGRDRCSPAFLRDRQSAQ